MVELHFLLGNYDAADWKQWVCLFRGYKFQTWAAFAGPKCRGSPLIHLFHFFFTVLILYYTEARVRNNVNDIKEIKKSALSSRVFALFAGVLSQWREQLPHVIPLSAGMPPYLRQRPKQDFRRRNTPTSHKLQVAENVPRSERFASGLSMLSECKLSVSTRTHKNKQPKSFLMQLKL